MPQDSIRVTALAPAIGAMVAGVDLSLAETLARQGSRLLELLYEHQVLVLPEQALTPPQLQAVAERFGTVLDHPAYEKIAGAPAVQVLESRPEAPSKIEQWHTDMTFSATPPPITMLHAQVIPAVGGDTLWSSAAAAYDALSPAFKALLQDLTAVHDFRKGFAESLAEAGGAERLAAAVAANPPVSHQVVLVHPHTGRRAIYVNPLFTSHIEQLSRLESEHLLAFLTRHVVRSEFQLRLAWRPRMLAIWDNRLTQHRPINDFHPAHRKHHRVTLAG